MYEIRLNDTTKARFMAEAKKHMIDKGWKIADLAAELDRPAQSLYNFFSCKDRPNRFLAAEIAEKLGMNPRDWNGSYGES